MTRRALVPTLVLTALMISLISSLGAPLVPSIATSYGVSLSAAQWSLTITLLVGAVVTPVLGRLGDGPRRRRVLLSVVGAVVAGSLLAALPLGFGALMAGRALQGLGLGLLPLLMALARDELPPERAKTTVGLLAVTGIAGVGLGYPATGLLAAHGGVHAAFWFGVALSALALITGAVVLPADRPRSVAPLDLVGAVLIGLGLGCLVVALAEASDWGWGSARTVGLVLVSVAVLAAWTAHELRQSAPLVDLRLLRHRGVLLADLTALLSGVSLYLTMSMAIRLVQTPESTGYGLGASAAVGGVVLLPMSVMSVATSRVLPPLTRRLGLEALLVGGVLVCGAGLALFGVARGSLLQIMVVLAVMGLGVGLLVSMMPALLLRSVPAHETGSATAFNQVLRSGGYACGSALSATILQAHTPAGEMLPSESGYTAGALVGLAICLVTVLIVLPLLPSGRLGRRLDLAARRHEAQLEPAGDLAGTGLAGTGLAGTGLAGTGRVATGLAGTGLAGASAAAGHPAGRPGVRA